MHDCRPFLSKIKFIVIDSFPETPVEFAMLWQYRYQLTDVPSLETLASGNIDPFQDFSVIIHFREEYQRDIAADFVVSTFSGSKFLLIVADADEIASVYSLRIVSEHYNQISQTPLFLQMELFYYNFGWVNQVPWSKVFAVNDKSINDMSLSNTRTYPYYKLSVAQGGWHASYFLSIPEIIRKIGSFSHPELNIPKFTDPAHIHQCIIQGVDIFLRGEAYNQVKFNVSVLPEELQRFHAEVLELQLQY